MELLDVYDDNGQKTGKVIEKSCKDIDFEPGEHIAVAIIYIENSNGEFLVQKTSEQKGRMYSMTGGHVEHNEEPIDAIKREVKEELGIDITKDEIISLGYVIFDFPVRYIFYLKKDIDLNDVILQKEEVELVSYMNINQIKDIIQQGFMNKAHAKIIESVLEYRNYRSKINMNYSYLMGVKDITELRNSGFIIEEIDGDFGIKFTKDKEKQYESFIIKNLKPGYWNEYLGDKFIFIFKYLDNTVKKFVYDKENEQEIFDLCCQFAECEFPSFMQMLKDNSFYAENYFNNNM